MSEWSFPLVHLFWLVPLVLLLAYLGSPRSRKIMMDERVQRLLSGGLPHRQYTLYQGLEIDSGDSTRRIPHLVVSEFGLFVIEPVYRPGRITGTRVQDLWTQRYWGRKRRFDNPMHQGELSVQALDQFLGVSGFRYRSLVVLLSNSYFSAEQPETVIFGGNLVSKIREQDQKVIKPEDFAWIEAKLKKPRLDSVGKRLPDRWTLLGWLLVVLLLLGAWFAFKSQLQIIYQTLQLNLGRGTDSEQVQRGGSQKTELELWEDSLACAYSADTGRCSCFEPSGDRVEVDAGKCKELAEKGSVLNR